MKLKTRSVTTSMRLFKIDLPEGYDPPGLIFRPVHQSDIDIITSHPGWEDLYHHAPMSHNMVLLNNLSSSSTRYQTRHNPIIVVPDDTNNIYNTSWTILNSFYSSNKVGQFCDGYQVAGYWTTYEDLTTEDQRAVDGSEFTLY